MFRSSGPYKKSQQTPLFKSMLYYLRTRFIFHGLPFVSEIFGRNDLNFLKFFRMLYMLDCMMSFENLICLVDLYDPEPRKNIYLLFKQ